MRIGITIDGVLRNFLEKLTKTYKKYFDNEVLVEDIKDYNLENYFSFNEEDSLNKLLYEDCSLEIFGYADEIENQVVTKLNGFIGERSDKDEIILISRECGRAIPSTKFFLSKTGCMVKEIRFVTSYEEMWELCDILVTTFPKALEIKPKNKKSIKINRLYNKDINSDSTIENTIDLFEEGYIDTIINTKTVEHKELN